MSRRSSAGSAGSQDDEGIDRVLDECGVGAPHRSALDFTADENRALDLIRLMLDMHRGQTHEPWLAAMQLAETSVGPFEGPYLVARVTAFVRALLAERGRPFAYMSAGCMRLSRDETEMMRLVRLARTGPFAELRSVARALAGQDHVCRILATAALLAQPDAVRSAASAASRHDEDVDPPPVLH